jgi:hypothetical protein
VQNNNDANFDLALEEAQHTPMLSDEAQNNNDVHVD